MKKTRKARRTHVKETTRRVKRDSIGDKVRFPQLGKQKLAQMIEEATVDCNDESELATGWYTMIEENLVTPFETKVLGVSVTVEQVALDDSEQIVAVCTRGRDRQTLPILDLPLPVPPPRGAEWIEAYRQWRGRG